MPSKGMKLLKFGVTRRFYAIEFCGRAEHVSAGFTEFDLLMITINVL